MTGWAMTFLIIALVAATMAFGGVPGTATAIAHGIFVAALVASAIAGVIGTMRKRR
ncbi:DUF1328 domain-containing protein [Bosea sp. (in: a-proteobacteria)]|jgi:uncharacterized membrane protein YtjA (UPF0391 family)|uniref:DUF1328 domain-containing protein n=1 Tax=Bosea sp. (in: a-proteobacteria) TaxID=1871050 RepID=UPI003F6F34AE